MTNSEPASGATGLSGRGVCVPARESPSQLLFCEGCCCGRTDRGFPAFPRDWIKSLWKQTKLNRHIQLTISGCLGPCDVTNIACILRRDGTTTWLGNLTHRSEYRRSPTGPWSASQRIACSRSPPSCRCVSSTALSVIPTARHSTSWNGRSRYSGRAVRPFRSSIAGLLAPPHGRSRQPCYRSRPSAGGRSDGLDLLRRTLSFPIPTRFDPGTP